MCAFHFCLQPLAPLCAFSNPCVFIFCHACVVVSRRVYTVSGWSVDVATLRLGRGGAFDRRASPGSQVRTLSQNHCRAAFLRFSGKPLLLRLAFIFRCVHFCWAQCSVFVNLIAYSVSGAFGGVFSSCSLTDKFFFFLQWYSYIHSG